MAKMIVEFEWDDDAGPFWMNIDNLRLCLFTEEHTREDLLKVEVLKHSSIIDVSDNYEPITLVRGLGSEAK